ncbi:MAG: LysR substrate-binding domain-containing protein [Pseudomonadota bacterium]
MDTIEAMRAFVRVVERASFIQSAQDLGWPKSRVSEAVQQLERRLRVRLLDRTTRHVSATAEGADYYRRCLGILEQIAEADSLAGSTVPAGPLRIEVHGTWARRFLFPGLADFLALYPGIALHVGEGDRLADPVREGIDCVIRIGRPADSELIGRRLGELAEGTFASPAYLARYGVPRTLGELVHHRMIGFVSSASNGPLPFQFGSGDAVESVMLPVAVSVTAAATNACLAVHGLGMIQVPRYRVAHELSTGQLVEVLEHLPPPPVPVYLLYPEGRQRAPRVKVFMAWAEAQFQRRLAELEAAPGSAL